MQDDEDYTAVSIEDSGGNTGLFVLSNKDPGKSSEHDLEIDGSTYQWTGPHHCMGSK